MPPISAIAEAEMHAKPWVWAQQWRDLLFVHWRMPIESIQRLIPPRLDLDTRDGSAWISAVAFNLETRRFGLTLRFPELNLRTYVRMNDIPGIFFLSLHAEHRLGVMLARRLTPLPYFHAKIQSVRTADHFDFASPLLSAACRLDDNSQEPRSGSLDEWLLERYAGFCIDRRGRLFRVAVSHHRWQVRGGSLHFRAGDLGRLRGFDLARQPDAWHFSNGLSASVGQFQVENL